MARGIEGIRVFVSSTSEDLNVYRAAARHVIMDMGWQPEMMEHFGALPQQSVEACRDRLAGCDLVLLISAFRRGWVPSQEKGGNGVDSITALEVEFARTQKIEVLAMLASEKTWPGQLWEDEQGARDWVKKFRSELNLPAVFFDYENTSVEEGARLPLFRSLVRTTLVAQKERLLKKAETTPKETGTGDTFVPTCESLFQGLEIPFVGPGVYGTGPLSTDELKRCLSGGEGPESDTSLATAAEYRRRIEKTRFKFLGFLKKNILEQQQRLLSEGGRPQVYDLLAECDRAPLTVSACWDQVLETCLAERGKSYAVVSHILNSYNGEHDGRILVVGSDGSTRICLADEVDLPQVDRIIYKPLGSPFLHDATDGDMEIDTVVATEADHVKFLGRLEHQKTQIPLRFVREFLRRPILFLGYALDVWQYRLIMRVFHYVSTQGGQVDSVAVRKPDTPMEVIAWRHLGSDMISMEPNDFAERALKAFEAGLEPV